MFLTVRYNPAQQVGNGVGKMAAAGTAAKGRTADKLSARTVVTITKSGRHSDGGGLYLNVTPTGARSWLFMWKIAGKRREMGLGSAREVSLKEARELAADCRKTVRAGGDPVAARKAPRTLTFGEAADELIESMGPTWRNAKHRAEWEMTLKTYCPKLRPMQVSVVATSDVLGALKPLWQAKPETASRLRGRIEKVLDYAKAKGMRTGENPAQWRGHLASILPKRAKLTRGHHAAMPFAEVPAFISKLREADDHKDLATGSAILVDAMGLSSFELCDILINQLANATTKGHDVQEVILNGALAVVKGIQPRDDLEALLAAQMAVTHNLAMELGRRLKNVDTIPQQDSAVNALTKLSRTFTTQLAALKNYRTGGEQRVTVTHVNVGDGGQAIVGTVNQGLSKGEGSQ